MSDKIRKRWESKFARFVGGYGVELLAAKLDVGSSAIYHWIRGATRPRPEHAEIIQRLACERGIRLTFDEIYGHSRKLRADEVASAAATAISVLSSPATVAPSRLSR
jgi:hypothetical protein